VFALRYEPDADIL